MLYYPTVESVEWQCIREPVMHMLRAAFSIPKDLDGLKPGYFIVASTDGYMERTYWSSNRTVPRQIGEYECVGITLPPSNLLETEYPVFHKNRTIFTQSGHVGLPYCVNIPDRHYFFHNLNHSFRSFHMGLPWTMKEPKIVYAGQARDNKYNFISQRARKMGVAPRDYFKSMIAPENRDIIQCDGQWMDRQEMIYFKYILDIDGTAATWDATAWKLNSGSVIFKPKSGWSQWFYDRYLPGVHYIEIEDDFRNIREKIVWCESHPIECMEMITRCKRLFQEVYQFTNVIEYTKKIVAEHVYGIQPKPVSSSSTIYDHIDYVFYINLDRRTDRRDHIESTFKEYGIDKYERFSAIPDEFGIVGCTKSHQAVLKLAKQRGYKNVLIFEDDFEFLVSPEEFEKTVCKMFSSTNKKSFDGDVCMFSYNVTQMEDPEEEDTGRFRILEASTASC